MALQLEGVDFGQYKNWPTVNTPSGGLYYQVPGTAFVWSPVTPKVLFQNPKPTQDAKKAQEKAIKDANSPMAQLTPVIGGVGGVVAANQLMKQFPSDLEKAQAALANSQVAQNSAKVQAQQAANTGTMQVAPAIPDTQAAFTGSGAAPVGTSFDGGTIMSDGSVQPGAAMSTPQAGAATPQSSFMSQAAPYAQGAFGAYGVYSGVKQYQEGDKVGGGLTAAQGAANVGTALGSSWAGAAGPYVAAAVGAYNTYKAFTNDNLTSGQQATKAQQAAALAVADYYTLGGASVLEKYGRKQWGGTMAKLDKLDEKINPVTIAFKEFGSSKDADQMMRDKARQGFQSLKVADQDFNVTLADGTKYNIGVDGKNKIMGLDGQTERHPYDVDMQNPLSIQAAVMIKPYLDQAFGKDAPEKMRGDATGLLANAATFNATTPEQVQANIAAMFGNSGVAPAPAAAGPIPAEVHRTYTRSPGILKSGERVDSYANLGKQLAERINKKAKK